jgi:hypothetical protein
MEATCSSETSADFHWNTRRYIFITTAARASNGAPVVILFAELCTHARVSLLEAQRAENFHVSQKALLGKAREKFHKNNKMTPFLSILYSL